jgi:hypothetical protein
VDLEQNELLASVFIKGMEFMNVHNTEFHVATLRRRGRLIATSRNKIGTRSRGSGWDHMTLHAERAVVKTLGDISQLRGCTLEVIRLNKSNEVRNSKPCSDCECFLRKCIREYGLRRVVYSSDNEDETARCVM